MNFSCSASLGLTSRRRILHLRLFRPRFRCLLHISPPKNDSRERERGHQNSPFVFSRKSKDLRETKHKFFSGNRQTKSSEATEMNLKTSLSQSHSSPYSLSKLLIGPDPVRDSDDKFDPYAAGEVKTKPFNVSSEVRLTASRSEPEKIEDRVGSWWRWLRLVEMGSDEKQGRR